jgi:hypothetical protein
MVVGCALFKDSLGTSTHVGMVLRHGRKQSDLDISYSMHIQSGTREKTNIFGSDSIDRFQKKSSYGCVSTSK